MDVQPARPAFRAIDESMELGFLRSLLDREGFGVAVLRRAGDQFEYVYANGAARRLASSKQLIGRTISEVWPAEGPAMTEAYARVLATGEPWEATGRAIHLTDGAGESRTAYTTTRACRLGGEGEDLVAVTDWDVTAEIEAQLVATGASQDLKRRIRQVREQQRESLMLQGANRILDAGFEARSEEALATLGLEVARQVTNSPCGYVAELRDDGLLHHVCEMGLQELRSGVAHRGSPGTGTPEIVHEILGLYSETVSEGRSAYTNDPIREHLSEAPDGHPALKSLLAVPLRRGDRTVGVLAVANRRGGYSPEQASMLEGIAPALVSALYGFRATRNLRRSTQLLDAHMSNSPMAIIEFGPDFRVSRWSAEAERTFGYTAEEMIGRLIPDMPWVHEDDVALVEAESKRLYSGAVTRSKNTNRNYRKDGSVIWCEWWSTAVHDENGDLVSVLSAVFDITARLQAEERLRLQSQRAAALKEVAEAAASALEVDTLGERLVDTLSEVTGADAVTLAVADSEGNLRIAGHRGVTEESVAEMTPVPEDSATYLVFSSGERRLVTHLGEIEPRSSAQRTIEQGLRSVASLPLLIEGRPIGVLSLAWSHEHSFSADEESFIESLAGEVAVGVENALLFEAERSRRRRIQALHGVLEVAVSSLDAAEAAQHILGYLMDHNTFDLAACWIARGEALELLAAINYPETYEQQFSPMPASSHYDSPRVLRSGKPVIIRNAARANRVMRDLYRALGIELGAYVIVPLRSRGRTVGTLNLGWHKPRAITPADLGFYESLGSELGVVLENAELLRERTEEARFAEALNRINDAVHSTFEFDEIMRRVVVESSEAAGFDGGAVHLQEGETWRFAYGHNMPDELLSLRMTNHDAAFSMAVLAKGDAIFISDATRDERASQALVERYGLRALLALPLFVRARPVGVLMTGSRREGFAFDDRTVDFMRKVASTVSLALENARLYDAERSIADRLQGALLTIPDEIDGIRFAHAYRSATEAARVGGDFYDLFELGSGRVGIVIGDVAGKGIDAAVLTSLVKNTVQAHASEPGKTPGQVLELTNEVVFKSTPMEAFVTVFFGVLDCKDGTLAYANGGHTSGALRRDAEAVALHVTGPLLGAFGTARYRDTWARLDVGDLLFLYTDGLTEARHGAEMFGESRVFECLEHAEGSSPTEVLSEVIGEVVAFTSGHLNDDLAVLAVQLTGAVPEGAQQQRLDV